MVQLRFAHARNSVLSCHASGVKPKRAATLSNCVGPLGPAFKICLPQFGFPFFANHFSLSVFDTGQNNALQLAGIWRKCGL